MLSSKEQKWRDEYEYSIAAAKDEEPAQNCISLLQSGGCMGLLSQDGRVAQEGMSGNPTHNMRDNPTHNISRSNWSRCRGVQ